MQDLQAFPKSALCPSTGVTLMGQRRMQVKRLIILLSSLLETNCYC